MSPDSRDKLGTARRRTMRRQQVSTTEEERCCVAWPMFRAACRSFCHEAPAERAEMARPITSCGTCSVPLARDVSLSGIQPVPLNSWACHQFPGTRVGTPEESVAYSDELNGDDDQRAQRAPRYRLDLRSEQGRPARPAPRRTHPLPSRAWRGDGVPPHVVQLPR